MLGRDKECALVWWEKKNRTGNGRWRLKGASKVCHAFIAFIIGCVSLGSLTFIHLICYPQHYLQWFCLSIESTEHKNALSRLTFQKKKKREISAQANKKRGGEVRRGKAGPIPHGFRDRPRIWAPDSSICKTSAYRLPQEYSLLSAPLYTNAITLCRWCARRNGEGKKKTTTQNKYNRILI